MATKAECKKCINRESCPILYAIDTKHIKADEVLRKKCISFEEEQCQKK